MDRDEFRSPAETEWRALGESTPWRMALHAERKLQEHRDLDGFSVPSLSADTVLVCVLRGDEAQVLVRRGVHLADRLRARLIVLHISEPGGGLQPDASRGHQEMVKALQLARALGAEVHTLVAQSNVSDALVRFAGEVGASQIVLGESPNSWLREMFGTLVREVLRRTKDMDVHIVRRAKR